MCSVGYSARKVCTYIWATSEERHVQVCTGEVSATCYFLNRLSDLRDGNNKSES
jgi:hypothetical protein